MRAEDLTLQEYVALRAVVSNGSFDYDDLRKQHDVTLETLKSMAEKGILIKIEGSRPIYFHPSVDSRSLLQSARNLLGISSL